MATFSSSSQIDKNSELAKMPCDLPAIVLQAISAGVTEALSVIAANPEATMAKPSKPYPELDRVEAESFLFPVFRMRRKNETMQVSQWDSFPQKDIESNDERKKRKKEFIRIVRGRVWIEEFLDNGKLRWRISATPKITHILSSVQPAVLQNQESNGRVDMQRPKFKRTYLVRDTEVEAMSCARDVQRESFVRKAEDTGVAPSDRRLMVEIKSKTNEFYDNNPSARDITIMKLLDLSMKLVAKIIDSNLDVDKECQEFIELLDLKKITLRDAINWTCDLYSDPKTMPFRAGNANKRHNRTHMKSFFELIGDHASCRMRDISQDEWYVIWKDLCDSVSKGKANRIRAIIVSTYEAISDRLGRKIPPPRFPKNVENRTHPKAASPEFVEQLIKVTVSDDPPLLLMFLLEVWCGIRPEEACKMRREFIDIKNGIIIVPYWVSKNCSPTRFIRIRPAMAKAIEWFFARYTSIVPPFKGNPYYAFSLRRKKLFSKAGWVDEIERETLRKAFVSSLIALVILDRYIQLEIGHNNNNTMRTCYDSKWSNRLKGLALWKKDHLGNELDDHPDTYRCLTEQEAVDYKKNHFSKETEEKLRTATT